MNQQNHFNNKLNDLTFVITGTLSQPRSYFETIIKENGGKVVKSVSKSLNYLVVGESGSKLKKAETLNSKNASINIITEQDFNRLLE